MDDLPMPPPRYIGKRAAEVVPDRCPAGHRSDQSRWTGSSGPGPRRYTCYACDPEQTFRPTVDLYDDLSWAWLPEEVAAREHWARVLREAETRRYRPGP